MPIRRNLRQARISAGLSQENIARAIDTTKETYRQAELGVNGLKLSTALRIATLLGHDVSALQELFAVEGDER